MNIKILEEEKVIGFDDVYAAYVEQGAVIFYRLEEEDDALHIVAEGEYLDGGNEIYFEDLDEPYKKLNELCKMTVNRCPKTDVSWENMQVMSYDYFYYSPLADLNDLFRYILKAYKISAEDLRLFLHVNDEADALVYFGYSIEPEFDIGLLSEEVHFEIKTMTYSDFIYSRSHRKITVRNSESESGLTAEIKEWVERTSFMRFEHEIFKRVIGHPELSTVLASVYCYLCSKAVGKVTKLNTIIVAPSGTGKTETFRALRDYFRAEIPDLLLSQVDLTQITEEGFSGKNTVAIVAGITKEGVDGTGIIWLDEFDKKLMPTYTSKGENVNAKVQDQILTLIEGRVEGKIDTTNTLFVACGSFNECRKKKGEIIRHVGFGREEEGGTDHYAPITKQDMIELGGSYELLGRFPLLVNLGRLDHKAILMIIDKTVSDLGKELKIDIKVDAGFIEQLFQEANTEYGCRQIKSKLTEAVMPAFIDALKKGDLSRQKIRVDKNGKARLSFNKENDLKETHGREEKNYPDQEEALPECE